jgi:Flp pilus assembly protein CpaB
LKRSNRLILLIGLFLAVVAFVGVFLLLQDRSSDPGGDTGNRTTAPVAIAKIDIPLGTKVTDAMVETQQLPNGEVLAGAIPSASAAIGQVVRQDVTKGQQLTSAVFATGTSGSFTPPAPGLRAYSLLTDQERGVGALIAPGDYVDIIVAFRQVDYRDPISAPGIAPVAEALKGSGTTTKVLLQGMRVLGTLLPPPPETAEGSPAPDSQAPTVNPGQQQIIILEVTAQQAEIIKFAQADRNNEISLALRSIDDFTDPTDPTKRIVPVPDSTSGIILRTLTDDYDVLTPEIVDILTPDVVPPLVAPELQTPRP